MPEQLYYGGVPVPYTVSWTEENTKMFLARCPHAGRIAISQRSAN